MSPRPPLRIVVNVGANQKVTVPLVLRLEKVIESQVSVEVSNGAIMKLDTYNPEFALATAPADTGAHFQSIGP